MTFLPVPVHGGASDLNERLVTRERAEQLLAKNSNAARVVIRSGDVSTVRRFGDGALTPLEGPQSQGEFHRVLDEERIIRGGKSYAWAIPFAFPITNAERAAVSAGGAVVLVDETERPLALLEVEDVFKWDKARYIKAIYGTERTDHPGARIVTSDEREWLIGGAIHVFPWEKNPSDIRDRHAFSPREVRAKLASSGWDAAVAFQTRNPLHRAHEYAMVAAVERLTAQGLRAGVVLNPLIGETKGDDVSAAVRLETYERLRDEKLLGQGDSDSAIWERAGYDINDVFDLYALDIKMFYGGPREALQHAIYRQNYGFSHIVIGRKHADAPFDDKSAIWGDFDAQEKFENLNGELSIQPVKIGFAAYYEELGKVGLIEEHASKGWKPVSISGSALREQLSNGETPDGRVLRPETSEILIRAYRGIGAENAQITAADRNLTWHDQVVTRGEREERNGHRGATLWFTGLSGSGKSTLANEVARRLHELGASTYVLDGDNIRQGLNGDLGFSPEDRAENIRRIGEVAKLFTDGGTINLTAFISPYREDRETARALQPRDFLEVHVHAELDVCEARDPKGLYKKARAGEIKGFTGISAPYEEPVSPEIYVNTGEQTVEESAAEIVAELVSRGVLFGIEKASTRELVNA